MNRSSISKAITCASRSLEPASEREAADAIKLLFAFCHAFGLGNPDPKVQVPFYRNALSGLPADLLRLAVERTTATWKWGNRMPLPRDISEQVAAEMNARIIAKGKAELALGKCSAGPNRQARPSPAKAAQAAAAVRAAAASTKPPRPVPEPNDDDLAARKAAFLAAMPAATKEDAA